MSLNLEAEKLQAKIDWLKEHLNTKKTAEELDAEFEVWYEEEKVKKEEQKIRNELTAQRVDEFVSKVVVFAKQYPEFKHNVYSSDVPYQPFNEVINVVFTAPNGKEQVGFNTMIDSVYNPYGEEETDLELYKTLINKLDCEFAKILSENKNE